MEEQKAKPRVGIARNMARDLIKTMGIKEPPIIIKNVVEELKKEHRIEVIPWDFGEKADGIQLYKDYQITIGYNRSQHPHRQRFTVAHEIGHFLLGHTTDDKIINLDSDKIEEIEANQFAAELLMPLEFIKLEFKKGNKKPANLAILFNVSEESMWWRLMDLKLLNKM